MYVCMYVTLLAQVHRRRGRGGAGGADPDGVRGLHERLRAAAAGQGAALLARVPRQVCRQMAQGNKAHRILWQWFVSPHLWSVVLCWPETVTDKNFYI